MSSGEKDNNCESELTRNKTEWVKSIYGERLISQDRVVPDYYDGTQIVEFIVNKLEANKQNNQHAFNAIVMGSYDIPHPSHEWYLRDCRARAAEQMLINQFGLKHDEITPDDIKVALTHPGLTLTCIIDSDIAINIRKGGQKEKGGIVRPVYTWQDRAERIAGYSYYNEVDRQTHNVVDYVIKEGKEFEGTPMLRIHLLAEVLKEKKLLDAYIVFGENPQSLANAKAVGFDGSNLIFIPTESEYCLDPRTGRGYHTSDIIKRIQGK
jgi:hypothetical protein